MVIEYNKEYYELIRAFIPKAKNEGYSINIEDEKLILNFNGEAHFTDLEEKFPDSRKNFIKYHLYKILSEMTGISLSWGILLGIRPLKLIRQLIETNGESITREILIKDYLVSEGKLNLATEVLKVQRDIALNWSEGYSLYVDIPFCPSICSYCSFPTFIANGDRVEGYLSAFFKEIDLVSRYFNSEPVCIYIGGGTPSAIGEDNLRSVLEKLRESFGIPRELTVEIGRPDTIDYELLKMLKEMKVDRISINPQTMSDETLNAIGRRHNSEDIISSYNEATALGFKNINMDLIIGLPGETSTDFKNTLEQVGLLNPSSISVHALALKKGSKLTEEEKTGVEDIVFEKIRDSFMSKNDYVPYYLYRQKNILLNIENIGYSKKGYESIYNILMMEDLQTVIGIGLGASTKVMGDGRFIPHLNTKDLNSYINDTDKVLEVKEKYLKEQIHEA